MEDSVEDQTVTTNSADDSPPEELSEDEKRLKNALFARVMRHKSVTFEQLKDEVDELATMHIK